MTDSDTGTAHVEEWIYECADCGHRIKIYQKEDQAVFCRCDERGPPMTPVERVVE